ncbi:MAG: hypothetical protein ACQEQS_09185 [Thermodesulfobacteriota bacterium]
MPFFIRLFSIYDKLLSIETLSFLTETDPLFEDIDFEKEVTSTHNQFIIKKKGLEAALIIENLPAKKDEDKFKLDNIIEYACEKKPLKSAKWVKKYLKKTSVLYEFIPLADLETEEDWEIFSLLYIEAWAYLRGIFQIKNEGFTNESGDIIFWDFPYDATGSRTAALRTFTGRWKTFELDIEDNSQKNKFLKGKIPEKSKIIYRG